MMAMIAEISLPLWRYNIVIINSIFIFGSIHEIEVLSLRKCHFHGWWYGRQTSNSCVDECGPAVPRSQTFTAPPMTDKDDQRCGSGWLSAPGQPHSTAAACNHRGSVIG